MTVEELIERLKRLPQRALILCAGEVVTLVKPNKWYDPDLKKVLDIKPYNRQVHEAIVLE